MIHTFLLLPPTLVAALCLVVTTGYVLVARRRFARWTRTEARVVGIREEHVHTDKGTRLKRRALLSFDAGERRVELLDGRMRIGPVPAVGSKVPLAYDPADPQRVSYGVQRAFVVSALVFSLAGFGLSAFFAVQISALRAAADAPQASAAEGP